ncbi:MAG: ATP-binding protein [Erysipelotrichia bacterium]|nr:ATP-binding protein [Erysipelotrichia bacterium]NCC54612.1 ATP-binding protein [Erysipelotrichia bacterium]
MFIARKKELEKLNDLYSSNCFEFAVVYGRRRVGKSTLIQKFCEDKNCIYFVGSEGSAKDNLQALSTSIFEHILPNIPMPSFSSYDELFSALDHIIEERIVLVIDEFPYLAIGDSSISSVIQKHIDTKWKNSKLMLILCGSSMSFMENQVLGYKSPLYGRRTAQFKIEPFHFFELKQFQWQYNAQDMAILYAITGGVAEYLSFINSSKSVKENIIELYLKPSGRMYEEPSNLLKQELRNPSMYHSVLNALAKGNVNLNEVATKVGELTSTTTFHLKSLLELGIIKKETPVNEKETSRKTLYSINDSSFIFWYRFIYGKQSAIVLNDPNLIFEKLIEPQLSDYMGKVFELICQEYMLCPSVFENAPFFYTNVGRWWGNNPHKKRQEEIDVCAMDNNHILLGECKWTNEKIDQQVLNDLIAQGSLFKQKEKFYYLFAKSGFSESVQQYAKEHNNLSLITIDDIYKA